MGGRPEPLTYYYMGSPISEAVKAARASRGLERVAVVGLGPVRWRAIGRAQKTGHSMRLIQKLCASRRTRDCSGSCRSAPRRQGLSSAMPA